MLDEDDDPHQLLCPYYLNPAGTTNEAQQACYACCAPPRDAERQQEDFELTDQSHDANCVLEPLKR